MKPAAQSYICDLNPYQPGLPIELVARKHGLDPKDIIKLASNENPLGMSPKAKVALEKTIPDAHRYPEQYALTQALSAFYGVDPEMVIVGNGSNDVLDLVARTFLNDGDEAISSQYAFAVYPIATQSVGATNVIVPAKAYGHDLPAMLQAITPRTKVIWIANPNNPTGTFVAYVEVQQFLKQVSPEVVVVLDEAYYEYLAPEDRVKTTDWLDDYPNLIIVRTFSKVYGLAGLRIGYGIMSKEIASLISRVRQPFNVSTLAVAAATAALEDTAFVEKTVQLVNEGRKQLTQGLRALNLEYLPAYGNFVTFRVADAESVNLKLLKKGVIVRPLGGYHMADWLRVTIGLPRENKRFLHALSSVLAS